MIEAMHAHWLLGQGEESINVLLSAQQYVIQQDTASHSTITVRRAQVEAEEQLRGRDEHAHRAWITAQVDEQR